MLELLFLLLPIAAGYGWYMGRRSVRQDTQQQSNQFSRQYVAGLNYLLSDESDKAVDLFIQLLEVDSETIETHLSLGNLFRQRGEVDRAIKIHQNLVARELTREQRQLALQELARDFLAAGLLDRAEALWKELCEDSDFEETALAQLLIIHQQLRDWDKAIEAGLAVDASKLDTEQQVHLAIAMSGARLDLNQTQQALLVSMCSVAQLDTSSARLDAG